MNRGYIIGLLLLSTALAGNAQMKDFGAYKDPELFTRMPNFYLSDRLSFAEKQYDSYEFWLASNQRKRVEGRWRNYSYYFDRNAKPPVSVLQIIRNYQNAAKRLGGKVVFEDSERTTIRMAKDGKDVWVEVKPFNYGGGYEMYIVEAEAMQQDVVANAEAFQKGIKENGHVEVPGIFFDFGKSELKPESEAALREVTKMLQSNPALNVWVVGHTDNVGTAEANLKLSAERAASVARALTQKMGIAAARLTAFGAGPCAPVASNATDGGRAKNRRVELVAK